jgi:hypothetical protein
VSDYLTLVYRRVLSTGDPALLQLAFDAGVLDRYRGAAGYSIIRTDSAGRVRKQGGWSLDFGIADGDRLVHASWQALSAALPETERDHWAMHATPLRAVSDMFLRMQLHPSSCHDDGEVRPW